MNRPPFALLCTSGRPPLHADAATVFVSTVDLRALPGVKVVD